MRPPNIHWPGVAPPGVQVSASPAGGPQKPIRINADNAASETPPLPLVTLPMNAAPFLALSRTAWSFERNPGLRSPSLNAQRFLTQRFFFPHVTGGLRPMMKLTAAKIRNTMNST
jgi:hypothetical protein